jgi:hypothetical protein
MCYPIIHVKKYPVKKGREYVDFLGIIVLRKCSDVDIAENIDMARGTVRCGSEVLDVQQLLLPYTICPNEEMKGPCREIRQICQRSIHKISFLDGREFPTTDEGMHYIRTIECNGVCFQRDYVCFGVNKSKYESAISSIQQFIKHFQIVHSLPQARTYEDRKMSGKKKIAVQYIKNYVCRYGNSFDKLLLTYLSPYLFIDALSAADVALVFEYYLEARHLEKNDYYGKKITKYCEMEDSSGDNTFVENYNNREIGVFDFFGGIVQGKNDKNKIKPNEHPATLSKMSVMFGQKKKKTLPF